MARRTKEDALGTRNQILDAAERLFEDQGVSRTSLQAIAAEAGITRGAIYLHFKDKADLFNAMMERIQLPIDQEYVRRDSAFLACADCDPIKGLRDSMLESLHIIENDPQVQRLLGICHYQIELTQDMEAVRQRMLEWNQTFYERNLMAFTHPRACAQLNTSTRPEILARTMQFALSGLVDSWLLTPQAFALRDTAEATMNLILQGAGIRVTSAP